MYVCVCFFFFLFYFYGYRLNRVISQHRIFTPSLPPLSSSPASPLPHSPRPCLLRLVWLWANFTRFAKGPVHWRDKQRIHFKMYPQGRHPVRLASPILREDCIFITKHWCWCMVPACAVSSPTFSWNMPCKAFSALNAGHQISVWVSLQCIYASSEYAVSTKWMQIVCMPGDIYSARHLHMTVSEREDRWW